MNTDIENTSKQCATCMPRLPVNKAARKKIPNELPAKPQETVGADIF